MGDIALAPRDCGRDAKAEAQRAYERAIEVEPENAAAREAYAWFVYAVARDPARADREFARAIEMGGGEAAFCGRASAQADMGREHDALATTISGLREHPESTALRELKLDIEEGAFRRE